MYQLEIDLEPTEIDSQKLYKATEEQNSIKRTKYVSKEKLGHIMQVLIDEPKELDFVRKAVGLFGGEKIKIERK